MTPLIPAQALMPGLQLKIEYLNPSLSIKHRSLPPALFDGARQGRIGEGSTLVIMTAGSAGISVAWAAGRLHCRAVLLMPESAPDALVNYARWLGAETRRGSQGQLEEWLAAYRQRPDCHIVEQLSDPAFIDHYQAVGEELVRQNPAAAAITVAAGTAASVMGIARATRPWGIPVYAVEPAEAAVLSGQPWQPHRIPGLAPPVATRLFRREEVAGIVPVPSDLAWDAARETQRRTGEPVGPSAGAAIAAARRLREEGLAGDIVAVCSSHIAISL